MNLVFTASVILILIFCLRKKEHVDALRKMGGTLFGVVYIGLLLSHAILLRDISAVGDLGKFALNNQGLTDLGFFFVVFAVACTFVHDTSAYYTGIMTGKHKLAPNISPGKTIEGTIGGFVACIIAGIVVNYIFGDPLSSDWAVALAILIALAALFGDLVESAIKRGAGLKDSGDIVPGHGGVLDRFDSLIFVFPVTYYFALVYYKVQGVWF
jgi:phosphatidate cytidylyltransferase